MKLMVVVCMLALITTMAGCNEERTGYHALAVEREARVMTFSTPVGASAQNNFVSVASLQGGRYVLANYAGLSLLDRKRAVLCQLSPQDLAGTPLINGESTVVYNPTGVHATADGRLYVANYKANNILVGRVDTKNCRFLVESSFSDVDTLGPENVVVDEQAGLLLSANYDAGTIVAFKLDSKEKLWVASVPQAHGITVVGSKAYATGLTERKLYELDLLSGSIVRTKGGIGWDPMAAQYMWPTSIYPLPNDRLLVSDPQTGYISVVDRNTLNVLHYTGGNGPANNLLNYPCAALVDGGEIIVLSSMRGGVLFLDHSTMEVVEKLVFREDKWPDASAGVSAFGKGWDTYKDMSGFSMSLAGKAYRLGFGNLHPLSAGAVLKVPDISTLFNPNSYIYFMQGYREGDVGLMFSSSSAALLATVHRRGGPDLLITKPTSIASDSWIMGDRLVSADTNVPLDTLVNEARETAAAYYSYLDEKGWVDVEHLYGLLGFAKGGLDREHYPKLLDNVFSSPAGREFKRVYDQCDAKACNLSRLKSAARAYYREAEGYAYQAMDEYMLVGMVSGVSANKGDQLQTAYDDCGQGAYLSGYGVEALASATLDDYLSATDLEHSAVCFSVDEPAGVQGVEVIWNDVDSAPTAVELYAQGDNRNSTWTLLGRFEGFDVAERDGFATSHFPLNLGEAYSRFQLKVIDGGSQHRLIMRQIKLALNVDASLMPERAPYDFLSCPDSRTYPGHGVEILRTQTLDDYFSALDLERSSVCFMNKAETSLVGIELGWYSRLEVGEKVEVFAANERAFTDEISLGVFELPTVYEVSGFAFSKLVVPADTGRSYYRLKLLKGNGQGRLILRSLTPLFASDQAVKGGALRQLARGISAELSYGNGINKVDRSTVRGLGDLESRVLLSPDAHCGNYALVFVNRLPKGAAWQLAGIHAQDGRIHVVVEVGYAGRVSVYDPTLGIEYPCDLNALIGGQCDYDADAAYYQINPVLQMYRGAGFFYGARIAPVYSSAATLMRSYF
ncbi:YncE family protein [Pseudomonas xanthosomatis]|uniref:YncE family protein n=1 Tax=Pseudomonas xanthosomatis TaxID=2842356 RepID=UPI003511ACC9